MRIYYIIISLASVAMVIGSYIGYNPIPGSVFSYPTMNLLWIVLFAKPIMIVLAPFAQCKLIQKEAIKNYIINCKINGAKDFFHIVSSILRLLSALVMKYRRLLGITVFILGFCHAGIYIANWLKIGYSIGAQLQNFWLLAGYIGIFCLLIGYITSNNLSIKLLKSKRKLIQNIAFVALIFAVLHIVFLNPGEGRGQIIILAIYVYLKLVERKKLPFVAKVV